MSLHEVVPGQALETALATDSYGPTECLVGFELDYSLEEFPLDKHTWTTVRQRFGIDPEMLFVRRSAFANSTRYEAQKQIRALEPCNDQEADRKQEWLEQIDDLTLPELVMFAAHRRLSRPTLSPGPGDLRVAFTDTDPQNTIEYRFGKGRYQQGYYDNEPEVRTMPAPPSVALERRRRVMETYRFLAYQNGLEVAFKYDDTNISFWRKTAEGHEQVHGLDTKDQALFCRSVGEVMLLALRDVHPAVMPYDDLRQNTSLIFGMGQYRTSSLRVTPSRFEHRIGRGEDDDASQRLAALIGGFMCGRQNPSTRRRMARAPAFGPAEQYNKDTDIHVLRAVEHSEIDGMGYLRLNEAYASVRGGHMLSALAGYRGEKIGDHLDTLVIGLVRTIQYQNEQLRCDPQALAAWKLSLPDRLRQQLEGNGRSQLDAEYLDSRLETVTYVGMRYVVEGFILDDLSRAGTFAQGLERYVQSPLLDRVIPRAVRRNVAAERMEWFAAQQESDQWPSV